MNALEILRSLGTTVPSGITITPTPATRALEIDSTPTRRQTVYLNGRHALDVNYDTGEVQIGEPTSK